MRRTSIMVLVLAVLSLALAKAVPAKADAPAAKAATGRRAFHAHEKTTRHSPAHTARHASVHTTGRVAVSAKVRTTSHTTSRRRLRAVKFSPTRPEPQLSAHESVPSDDPAQEREPQTVETATEEDPGSSPDPAPVVETSRLTGKRAVMPPPMRGSLASLERQNERADAEGLERIEDEDDLSDRIARGFLVPVPASAALTVNGNLPEHHRYCRPWTAHFLTDLARAHAAQFHSPLEVSSAVRTVEYQKRLMTVNGNAAAAEGDIVSPHLTGATIDIAKSGMTRLEIGWMRGWLMRLETASKIDVEEEFQQACFHITVYMSYVPARPASSIARAGSARSGAARSGRTGAGRRKHTAPKSRPGNVEPDNIEPDNSDTTGGTPALGL